MDALILSSDSVVLVVSLTLLLFVTTKKLWVDKRKYHPTVSSSLHVLFNFRTVHDYVTRLTAKHTTFRVLSLFGSNIITSDPVVVEHILKSNFDNYGKGWHNYKNLRDLLGDGIFAVDGHKWRHQRKVSSYEFSTRNLRDFSSHIFRRNAAKLANVLAEAACSNRIVDIQDMFMKSTLDSIFKVAFGVELDSMCDSSEQVAEFSYALDEASMIIARRYVDVLWPIKKYLNVGLEARLKKNIEIVDNYVYKLIHNKVEQMQKLGDSSINTKDDILSRFLQLDDVEPKYLRDITLGFLIAGKDTTASTLSWFIYALCKNPEIQEKLYREINSNEGSKVDDDSLRAMQYLQATLSETLRLYPAVPGNPKICFADDTLPDGFSVKKGEMVYYHPYAMGRMKSIWGDDAECFRPERWLDENGMFQQESPFKFPVFQAGPRICLGKEFAHRQMKIFSAVLLSSFRFRLGDQNKAVNYKTMLNLLVDGGLHVEVLRR